VLQRKRNGAYKKIANMFAGVAKELQGSAGGAAMRGA
jgi:hypothetical protein